MTGDQLSIDDALSDLGRVIPSRSSDPDTSRAAEPVKIKAGTQRARLLEAFATAVWIAPVDGLTDEQAMEAADHVSPFSEYSKRCSELRDGGYITPTGETRVSPSSGKARIVSRITPKGAAWLRETP